MQAAIPEAVGQGKDGFLTLQDRPLIAAVVNAIKEIASITDTFKSNLIAWLGSAANGITDLFAKRGHFGELCTTKSDGTEVCASGDQLAAILGGTNAGAPREGGGAPASQPVSSAGTASTTTPSNDNQPPAIQINGANPAQIKVGDKYADLGAQITAPQADLNLGIHTFVDGIETDPVVIDTTAPGSHIIEYVVSDSGGLTSCGVMRTA